MPATFTFDRGYTGHEHLDAFGLINMNGRMYDPVIARFLSPDNNVQAPDNSQGYNRYSYCFNNPLIYTDPSGNDPSLDLETFNHWGEFSQHKHRNRDMDGTGGYTYNWFSNQYTYNGVPTSYNNVYNNYILPNGTTINPNEIKATTGSEGYGLPIQSTKVDGSSFSPSVSGGYFTMVFWGANSFSVAINIKSGAIETYGGVNTGVVPSGQGATNVLGNDAWRSQAPDWTGCFRTCCKIVGGTPSKGSAIYTARESGKSLQILPAAQSGVTTINSYLNSGKPIIVGVNHHFGLGYNEGTTDHFVVIMGSGQDNGQTYYRFFDVGTTRIGAGASPLNRFYLGSDNSLIGVTQYNKATYTVSQVRPF